MRSYDDVSNHISMHYHIVIHVKHTDHSGEMVTEAGYLFPKLFAKAEGTAVYRGLGV